MLEILKKKYQLNPIQHKVLLDMDSVINNWFHTLFEKGKCLMFIILNEDGIGIKELMWVYKFYEDNGVGSMISHSYEVAKCLKWNENEKNFLPHTCSH